MEQQELKNGNIDVVVGGDSKDTNCVLCNHCGAVSGPAVPFQIPQNVISSCAAILSIGVVIGVIYFMHLCFLHPDSATTLVPLLLTVLTWAATRWHTQGGKCNDPAHNPGSSDAH